MGVPGEGVQVRETEGVGGLVVGDLGAPAPHVLAEGDTPLHPGAVRRDARGGRVVEVGRGEGDGRRRLGGDDVHHVVAREVGVGVGCGDRVAYVLLVRLEGDAAREVVRGGGGGHPYPAAQWGEGETGAAVARRSHPLGGRGELGRVGRGGAGLRCVGEVDEQGEDAVGAGGRLELGAVGVVALVGPARPAGQRTGGGGGRVRPGCGARRAAPGQAHGEGDGSGGEGRGRSEGADMALLLEAGGRGGAGQARPAARSIRRARTRPPEAVSPSCSHSLVTQTRQAPTSRAVRSESPASTYMSSW